MAQKNNTKTIRLSDEMLDLIDQQNGTTFTEKFETLVTKCVWEAPAKEKELKRLEEQIRTKQNMLAAADSRYAKMLNHLRVLEPRLEALEYTVAQAITDWKVEEL